jgi:hypothetical protein
MILGTYEETYGELLEDQWLLKLREDTVSERNGKDLVIKETFKTGFLTKLTQKGKVPVKFEDWGKTYTNRTPLPTFVWQESFRAGWKLKSWRIIKSPEGFTLEIYLTNFLEIVLNESLDQGVIVGKFKWENNKLIKNDEK